MPRKLIDKGNASWDLIVSDGVRVELSREQRGWRFWGVVIDGERMGGARDRVPAALAAALDALAADDNQARP